MLNNTSPSCCCAFRFFWTAKADRRVRKQVLLPSREQAADLVEPDRVFFCESEPGQTRTRDFKVPRISTCVAHSAYQKGREKFF